MRYNPRLIKKYFDSFQKKGIDPAREFESLLAVLNEMFDENDRQRIIIFQGDGSEIVLLKPDANSPYPVSRFIRGTSGRISIMRREAFFRNYGFSDVKEAVEKLRATIYSIIPGVRFLGLSKKEQKARADVWFTDVWKALGWRNTHFAWVRDELTDWIQELLAAEQTAMSRVAEISGGFTSFLEKPEDAENVYSGIFKQISSRYVIGYYRTDETGDAKRRIIKVEVRNHPEYVITGQKAYFPQ